MEDEKSTATTSKLESTYVGCGLLGFYPKWVHRLRNMKLFLFISCLIVSTQGAAVSGFTSVFLSTIERRFNLNSFQVSFISVGYDVASIFSLIPISYFGGKGHKPKWIAGGTLLMGIGSFIFTLPHFLSGPYISLANPEQKPLCMPVGNVTKDVLSQKNVGSLSSPEGVNNSRITNHCAVKPKMYNHMYLVIMCIANMCLSVGSTPLYTIVISYFYANLPKQDSPIYFALYYASAMMGPAFGYLGGGHILRVYIDVDKINTKNLIMTPKDAGWLGAWWLGFMIAGFILVSLSIPISMFPQEMPEQEALREIKRKERKIQAPNAERKSSVLPILRKLMKIPMFNFINLSGCAEGAAIAGFMVFAPKYVEAVYHLSSSKAGQLIGYAALPPGCLGMLLGGFVIRYFGMGVLQALRFCQVFVFVACLLAFGIGIICPPIDYAGVNFPYEAGTKLKPERIELHSECNDHCNCSIHELEPVCGRNGITYVSPCFAGCTNMNEKNVSSNAEAHKISYKNCKCVDSNSRTKNLSEPLFEHSAISGICKQECYRIYFFLFFYPSIIFVVFLIWTPILTATIGLIPENTKSLSLAVQWVIVRVFGMIPARIIFGKIIDSACLLWRYDVCTGLSGACAVYTTDNLSTLFMVILFSIKIISLTGVSLAAYTMQKAINKGLY